jgi:hypothetical protein
MKPMTKQLIFLTALLVSFAATYWWYNQPVVRTHTVSELIQNGDKLVQQLPKNPKTDFKKLMDRFADMDKAELEKYLSMRELELEEASYGLHFLGNRYLQNNQFDSGVICLKVSAEAYFNAVSYLKLAQIYTSSDSLVQSKYPDQKIQYAQDAVYAADCFQRALMLSDATLAATGDNYVMNQIQKRAEGIAELVQKSALETKVDLGMHKQKFLENSERLRAEYTRLYKTNQ